MSYSFSRKSFARDLDAGPGDVFAWSCPPPIGKRKYHLCISYDYDFVFLNTPKDRRYPSDFHIAASNMRFLKPTETRFSSVSCVELQAIGTQARFHARCPEHLGNLATDVLFDLTRHICNLRTTVPEDAERLEEVVETMRTSLVSARGRRSLPHAAG